MPLRDRLIARPTLAGLARRPGGADRQLDDGNRVVRALAEKVLGHPPQGADAALGRAHPTSAVARAPGPTPQARPGAAARTVVFFHGCGAELLRARPSARKAVEVLEHNGFEVIVPKQGCCGLPLQSNGLFDDARGYVRRLAAHLAPYARAGHDIVATSTSCGLMLKREAHEILGVEDDDLRVGRRADVRHLRVPGDAARARRAAHRLLAGRRWRCPTTPPASSGGTAWAPRPWS